MTVREAASLILRGKLVVFPTETVYGIGADAWSEEAVRQIFEHKGRPSDNPLIIHIDDGSHIREFASEWPPELERLADACWPGPLTVILPKRPEVPDLVTGGLPTVALRVPDHPLALELIRASRPLAAPSANISGRPSPTRTRHVEEDFGRSIPILEGGEPPVGLESTVLDLTSRPFRVLRPGHYSAAQLQKISNAPVVIAGEDDEARRQSPGTRYSHYRPKARVSWWDPAKDYDERDSILLVTHSKPVTDWPHQVHIEDGLPGLGRRLYDLFRKCDREGFRRIALEPLPPDDFHPIVAALRNRIERAIGDL